jgi:hypothetical protein
MTLLLPGILLLPDTAFRQEHGVGITMMSISGLNCHGLLTHCVRFAPAGHPSNGDTRYRCVFRAIVTGDFAKA